MSTVASSPAASGAAAALAAGDTTVPFSLDGAWALNAQVALRPERFGALAYHFGTRRLSFLKSPRLLAVVEVLADHSTAREACLAAGLTEAELPSFSAALATLARTDMIVSRDA